MGWSTRTTPNADLVSNAMALAATRRQPTKRVVHHSDRGTAYTSISFSQRIIDLERYGSPRCMDFQTATPELRSVIRLSGPDALERHCPGTQLDIPDAPHPKSDIGAHQIQPTRSVPLIKPTASTNPTDHSGSSDNPENRR